MENKFDDLGDPKNPINISKIKKVKIADKSKYCSNCGEKIDTKAEICPMCGVRVKTSTVVKSPELAAILSFLVVGLGQIYNGEIGKGILFVICYVVSIVLCFFVIGLFLLPVLWIYSIYEAYDTAKKINNGEIIA